jgi:hypothetical protein
VTEQEQVVFGRKLRQGIGYLQYMNTEAKSVGIPTDLWVTRSEGPLILGVGRHASESELWRLMSVLLDR